MMFRPFLVVVVAVVVAVSSKQCVDTGSCTQDVDCKVQACWEADATGSMSLTIKAITDDPTSGWAAIGFSENTRMADTDIISVYIDSGGIARAQNRLAVSYAKPVEDSPDVGALANITGSRAGSNIEVSLDRVLKTSSSTNDKDLSNCPEFYIILATGDGEFADKHSIKVVSTDKVEICGDGSASTSLSTLANSQTVAHGMLMVLAFLFLFPVGIFDARFMKAPLGSFWIKVHIACQTIGLLLCIVAAAIMFNDIGFSLGHDHKNHKRIGFVVFILTIFQYFLGVMRNAISGKTKSMEGHGPRRWIFNYLHIPIGFIILVLSQVNMFTGVDITQIQDAAIYGMYAWFAVLVVFTIIASVFHYLHRDYITDDDMPSDIAQKWRMFFTLFVFFSAGIAIFESVLIMDAA